MPTYGFKRFIVQLALLLFCAASAGPLDLKDSRVRVPWDDFKQIIDRLSQQDSTGKIDTVFAPRDYVIRSLSISGTIKDEKAVQLEGDLALQVFASETLKKSGWVKIPIGNSGYSNDRAVVIAASMNGRNVSLLDEGGTITLLIGRTGNFTVKLSYSCPIIENEGTRRLALSIPNAAAGFLDLFVPGKRVEVTVNEIKRSSELSRNGTKLTCAFNAGGDLSVALTPLADDGAMENAEMQMSPKIFAATGMLVSIKENQVRYRYRIDYQIWHKKVTSFAIAMSDTMPIEQVEGAGIQEWKVERVDKKPMLVVRTNFAPEKEYSLFVDFSQKLDSASGTIRVPEMTATGVSRESGYLAVVAAQTIEVTGNDSSAGLTPADPQEMPAWLQQERDLIMKYKYSKHPYCLALDIRRHADMPVLVAIADEAHFQAQITAEGYALAKFCYTIRNNYKQYLSVTMPAGWTLWSSLIDGAAVMPATGKDSCQLLIPLKKTAGSGEGSGFVLELVYWKEFGAMRWAGGFAFEMPLIDINCQQIHGELWTPKRYSYSRFKGTLKKVASYSSGFLDSYNRERYGGRGETSRLTSHQNFFANQQVQMKTARQAMSLPVEVDIPATGVRFLFGKSLTIAGEKANLSLGFITALPAMDFIAIGIAWIVALLTGFFFCRLVIKGKSAKKIAFTALAGVFTGMVELAVNELSGVGAPGLFGSLIAGAVIALLNHFALLPKRISSASAALILAALLFKGAGSAWASEDETEADLGSTSIAIPWSDFKPLLDKLQKRRVGDTTRVTPPCDYTIAQARFDAEKKSERECVVSALLSITVLNAKGWTVVPVGGGCALYPDVRLNNAPAPLGKDDGGNNVLVIKGAGDYELTYRFAVPLTESAGRCTFTFPLPRQAAASFSITLDEGGYAMSANGRRLLVRPAGKGRYTYFGGLGSGEVARIDWQREVTQQGSRAAMLLGQASTFYSIGMGMIGLRSDITLTILHQDIRRFSVAVPVTADIIDLTGPAVATWESIDSADQRLVTVFLKYNVRDKTTFTLTAEQAYDDTAASITLPSVTLPGATRQEGYIGVGVISNVELTPANHSSNVVRKDKRELPAWFAGQTDALYVYQYLSGSYAIGFTLNRHRNVAAISALVSGQSIASVMREDGKTITQIEMTVKNRGEQFLRLRWRRGWQLWSLFCNGNAARPAFDSTAGELLVPLDKSTEATAETRVKIVYLSVGGKYGLLGRQKIDYPSADMPVQNVNGNLYIPRSISSFLYGGNMKVDEAEKKQYFTLFWPDFFGPIKCATVATDFYQKAPSAPVQVEEESRGSQTEQAQTQRPAELKKMKEDIGAIHHRVTRQGVQGMVTREKNEEIDALLQEAKVLKSGIIGRTGSAGIGNAGNSGDVFGAGGFAADADALQDEMQQEAPLPAQALGATESGLLSIPVNISFDGSAKPFSVLMLKSGESPKLTFMYRKVPDRTPFIVNLMIFIGMLLAAGFLTRGLWAGWSKRLVGYGIALPAVLAFGLARLADISLSCNLLWIVPLLFFSWKAVIGIRATIASRKKVEQETEKALKEAMKPQETKGDVPPTPNGPVAEGSKPLP